MHQKKEKGNKIIVNINELLVEVMDMVTDDYPDTQLMEVDCVLVETDGNVVPEVNTCVIKIQAATEVALLVNEKKEITKLDR